MTIKIKKLTPDALPPKYALPGDAGMDIFSNQEVILEPNQRRLVSTGIAMQIPPDYVGLVWDKSGIAAKHGIKTMAGVIDSSYRGEIKILLCNLSNQPYKIEKNNKIAQILIQPIKQKEIIEVENLEETKRGVGGFGSTGLK